MKEITIEESKKIQLMILDSIDLFCKSNNLRYSLAYGTLLGAVRHHGFIPWDDDIDIMMPRPDYDKFLKLFKQENLKVQYYGNDKTCPMAFAKVIDNRTLVVQPKNLFRTGIWVDVFPIDGYPNDDGGRYFKEISQKVHSITKSRSLLRAEFFKPIHVLAFIVKHILDPRPRRNIIKDYESLVYSHDFENSDFLGCSCCMDGYNEIMPSDVFKKYIVLPFEGKEYSGIKVYVLFRKKMYGDYMSLPPIEEQVGHHDYKMYWK